MASEDLNWKRSSFCESNGCVYVTQTPMSVYVTGEGRREILRFTPEEWAAFVAGVKAGEFDL